jgi:hypothetical protein
METILINLIQTVLILYLLRSNYITKKALTIFIKKHESTH